MTRDDCNLIGQKGKEVDPDPMTIILEVANLIIQPGSLALIVAGASAVIQYKDHKQLSDNHRSKIRGKLYEIDRALNDGFGVLMTLASLLDQFNYTKRPLSIGGAPIRGYKNCQKLRRAHEDCRAAVKEARDAFIDLSELLPAKHSDDIALALGKLNRLYQPLLVSEGPYARSLIAGALAFNAVDELICNIGPPYDFVRMPRSFIEELVQSIPRLKEYEEPLRRGLT